MICRMLFCFSQEARISFRRLVPTPGTSSSRALFCSMMSKISSPNRAEYSDARGYTNEFHVKELYRAEFSDLLGSRFKHLKWYSQRNAFVSLIVPDDIEAAGAETLTKNVIGFNNKKDLELFLMEEPKLDYKNDINLQLIL